MPVPKSETCNMQTQHERCRHSKTDAHTWMHPLSYSPGDNTLGWDDLDDAVWTLGHEKNSLGKCCIWNTAGTCIWKFTIVMFLSLELFLIKWFYTLFTSVVIFTDSLAENLKNTQVKEIKTCYRNKTIYWLEWTKSKRSPYSIHASLSLIW